MAPLRASRQAPLAALFLVSLGTVGFEIALTRFFAVSKWSEYGYWVISIVLAGFAFSGVVVALARTWCARHATVLLAWLPACLVLAAGIGDWLAAGNAFNPLQLQNSVTFTAQLGQIALYYVALLPFFALAGLFISLCFLVEPTRLGLVYGTDLAGAGTGGIVVLALMTLVHPFQLAPCLLLPLAAASLTCAGRAAKLAALAALLASGALLLFADPSAFNDFKAIYAPLHTPDARIVAELRSPHGLYDLLDDFTERVDTDVSNNAGMLGFSSPPTSFGLYRDGNRVASLPRGAIDAGYAGATLAALPYVLRPAPRVLLAGASGGFRVAEALALGASNVAVSEPEPILRRALGGLAEVPPLPISPCVRVLADPPLAVASREHFDLVDLSADFADSSEANASSLTVEAIAAYLRAVPPDGLVSLPVSIREFPAYATRMLATVRAALLATGAADPALHVLVVRSAWNVRILASPAPFTAAAVTVARAWADARSFDISWYPGIDVVAARAGIYNDLPQVSFRDATVASGDGAHDAVAEEAQDVLAGRRTASEDSFDLSPVTLDRPTLSAVLRLSDLPTIFRRLELLPQGEVAPLVNVAVLAQAAVIALLVLAVPLLAGARFGQGADLGRASVYFSALGLGFLMIEIAAIEAASQLLTDRIWAFAIVLTSMLVFSGLGSFLSGSIRLPRAGLLVAVGVVLAWCAAMLLVRPIDLVLALTWPFAARLALLVAIMAVVSVPLGLPFPLGLGRLSGGDGRRGGAVAWAWALNGAFSVVATPLANLIAIEQGRSWVFCAAILLYVMAGLSFPRVARVSQGLHE